LTRAEELKQGILDGDRRALARAATLIENESALGREALASLFPFTGRAVMIGVTGPPGVGKSTLTAALTSVLRQQGKRVGVLAVDPSSSFSRGAILGDRIRMQEHHADPGVFIRSMATRGRLGGLSAGTFDVALLLDAASFDVVLIETVGVGQDEVEISSLADVTVLVLTPGMGDDVQAMKAGIMEIADLFVINKADLPGAERLEQEIRTMQGLSDSEIRIAPVRRTVATTGQGVDDVLGLAMTLAAARLPQSRKESFWPMRIRQMLRERLLSAVRPERMEQIAVAIEERQIDPYTAVDVLANEITGTNEGEHGPGGDVQIDHLGIAVRTLDEGLAFYQKQLGMDLQLRETVTAESVNVAMLPAGNRGGAPRIELLEATTPDSTIAKFIEKRGPGLHHVALKVADLSATLERMKQAGVRVLNEPKRGAGGHLYVFIHPESTGGVLLELIQR
jgi:LAO/AO transport system kinase